MEGTLQKVRSIATSWIAEQTLHHLEAIRRHELDVVLALLPDCGRVLEIGAGAGWQAQFLASRGYGVSVIDLPSSNYLGNRVWPVINYDGSQIPFESSTFDIVFSSNVLAHSARICFSERDLSDSIPDSTIP